MITSRPALALALLSPALLFVGCGDSSSDYDFSEGDDGGSVDIVDAAGSTDLRKPTVKPMDMAWRSPPDLAPSPITGTVGPKGGTVSRLFFGFSGDARPTNCNEHNDYPTAILDSIFTKLNAANVQFSMDLGDHMFICQNGSQNEADAQMGLYMSSAAKLMGKTTFLTEGNHDCVSMDNLSYCGVNGFNTVNNIAFMNALQSTGVSPTPYYTFDVKTNYGLARFVVVADNAWSTAQQNWLQTTLADADAQAKYIFIFRHHPLDNTDWPAFATISQMVMTPKHRTILFEGHDHEYRLDTYNDKTGRTIIIGNAGAELTTNFTWYGYGTVEQLDTGNLAIRLYDQSNNNQMAAYQIAPQ